MPKCPDSKSEYNINNKLYIKIEPSTGEYGSVVSINGIDLIVSSQENILEEVLSFLGYEVEIERMRDETK